MKPGDSITIRLATPDDAATVHAMIVRLAETVQSPVVLSSTSQSFESALSGSKPAIYALIAEQDAQPLGVAMFFMTFSTWYGTPGVYVQDIYVNEDTRGTGLGRRLLAGVARWGATQGANHLRLSVDSRNEPAQSFYERNGLTHRDDEKVYMIEGDSFESLKAST